MTTEILIGRVDNLKAFEGEQLVSASEAVRKFSKLREDAKERPRLILESNQPNTVLVSFELYEQIIDSLVEWESRVFDLEAEVRQLEITLGKVDPVSADDLFTSREKKEIKEALALDISDEELFE